MTDARRVRRIVGSVLVLLSLVPAAWWIPPPAPAAAQSPGLDAVVALGNDACYWLVVRADGTVWGWTYNSDWNLGVTLPDAAIFTPTPVQVPSVDHVRGVACGYSHALALRADGTVWAWGRNDHGQVGVPPGEDCPNHPRPCVMAPVPVPGLSGVKAVAATDTSSFALKADGTVWAWGDGALGQLGNASTADTVTPTLTEGLTDVVEIAAVGSRVVALRGDGTVLGWGGSDGPATPTQVPGLEGMEAVAAGLRRNLALKADGSVWSWGEQDNPTPSPVAGLGPMTAIAGGNLWSVAVAADGTVWSWGLTMAGSPPPPPTQANGLSDVVAIAMHVEENVALKTDGTVWTWRQSGTPDPVPVPTAATPTA